MAFAYSYDGTMYLAITRRCTLACTFCPKVHGRWVVAGNDMSHDKEPQLDELLAAAHALAPQVPSKRVALVGLGEPTMRLELLAAAGRQLRSEGFHVRLVTDGLANLRAGKDVTAQLEGAVDEVSVSLNAPDGETYARVCPSRFGAAAHQAVCEFIGALKPHVPTVLASVVTAPGVDLEATRALAAKIGVLLRVRPYFDPLEGEPHEPQAAEG